MKKMLIAIIAIVLCFAHISSGFCDAFYRNLKEELAWALEYEPGNSAQGYKVYKYDHSILGVIVGFDLVTNSVFIVGEISPDKYEMCRWDCIGYDFNNLVAMYNIIATDGIVNNITGETPINYTYRWTEDKGWESYYLEDEESAFILQAKLHGWSY